MLKHVDELKLYDLLTVLTAIRSLLFSILAKRLLTNFTNLNKMQTLIF
jgi:hypothetical protein